MEKVFYSPAKHTAIDQIDAAGLSHYTKENLAQIQVRHPDAIVVTLDEAVDLIANHFKGPVVEITEERFQEMLEVLFPLDWECGGNETWSFKCPEMTSGNITMIFCRIGKKFYEFSDSRFMKHKEIVARCMAAAQSNPDIIDAGSTIGFGEVVS